MVFQRLLIKNYIKMYRYYWVIDKILKLFNIKIL